MLTHLQPGADLGQFVLWKKAHGAHAAHAGGLRQRGINRQRGQCRPATQASTVWPKACM